MVELTTSWRSAMRGDTRLGSSRDDCPRAPAAAHLLVRPTRRRKVDRGEGDSRATELRVLHNHGGHSWRGSLPLTSRRDMSLRSTLGLSREASLLEGEPDEVAAKRRRVNVEQVRPARLEAARHHRAPRDAPRGGAAPAARVLTAGVVSSRLRVRSARAEGCGRSARATCPSLPARGSPLDQPL